MITVVIPAYNSESTIERALSSVFAQSLAPSEVLVVDDQSNDGTAARVLALRKRWPQVRLVTLEANAGPGNARQVGLEMAAYEFVAFLDSDDEWNPLHLQVSIEGLRANNAAGAAFSSATRVTSSGGDWPPLLPSGAQKIGFDRVMLESPVVQSSVVATKACLLSSGGYRREKRHAEDYDLWLRVAAIHGLVWLNGEHVRLYVTPGQLSQARHKMALGMWEALRYFESWAPRHIGDWDDTRFRHLVDERLDMTVRDAVFDWDRAIFAVIFTGANMLSYVSPRIRYWKRWLYWGWPWLYVGHLLVSPVPRRLRQKFRAVFSGNESQ